MKPMYNSLRLTPVLASLFVATACADGPTASRHAAPRAGAVAAQTATDQCIDKIDALVTQTTSVAGFTGQNSDKDRTGLVGKLNAAKEALQAGKTADAIRKLTDFRDKVAALGSQGKLDAGDAAALAAGADDAIACIQGIGTGA